MATWKGKTRGNPLGYKIFIFFIKNFGLSVAYFALFFVAIYFFFFASKSVRSLSFFYRNIFHYGKLKSSLSIFKNFTNFGKVLLDKTASMAGFKTKFKFNFDGEEYLHEMAKNTGGILISAHIGNFEMAGNMLERIKTKINIVILDAEHERIKNLLDPILKKTMNLIPLKKDMSHMFLINQAVSNKEIICIHGDRFIDGERTIEARLFGKPALFPAGPFRLAVSYGTPVSFVFAMKERNFKYHFYATPPKIYSIVRNRTNREEELREITNDYIFELEKMLTLYPLQWFNHYPFWKEQQA